MSPSTSTKPKVSVFYFFFEKGKCSTRLLEIDRVEKRLLIMVRILCLGKSDVQVSMKVSI